MIRNRNRILLVEDNPADAWMIEYSIRTSSAKFGADGEVYTVSDGEIGIEAIMQLGRPEAESGFDLLIVDLNLPRFSGEEVIGAWRASSHATLPLIVVTSLTQALAKPADSNSNSDRFFFTKPMELQEYLELGKLVDDVLLTAVTKYSLR